MSTTQMHESGAAPSTDSGVRASTSARYGLSQLMRAPELGALVAAVAVFAFFAIAAGDKGFLTGAATAGWLNASAELALVAIPVGLLMIAGEFDLSVGSVVGASSITVALGTTVFELPFPLCVLACLAIGVITGVVNGMVVTRTKLPSFIVTLAANFVLVGLALGVSRTLTGTSTVSMSVEGLWDKIFGSAVGNINVSVFWALGVAVVGMWVLSRTRMGGWIYATGRNLDGANKAGVPTDGVKVCLFVATGASAALVGVLQASIYNSGNAVQGQGFVFQAPIVAVIGGVLLVGGYGSVLGVVLGTVTYGIVSIGLFYTGWTSDWLSAFIGTLLILAVMANEFVRRLALRPITTTPKTRTAQQS